MIDFTEKQFQIYNKIKLKAIWMFPESGLLQYVGERIALDIARREEQWRKGT